MENKKTVVIIFFLLALMPFLFGETKERSALKPLIVFFMENEISIEEYKLHTRGVRLAFNDKQHFAKEAERFIQKMPSFNWEKQENFRNDGLFLKGTFTHPDLPLEETLSIYSYPTKRHSYTMYVSYEMVAKQPNFSLDEMLAIEEKWLEAAKMIFRGQRPAVYAAVKGKDVRTGDLHERGREMIADLNAEIVEQVGEETFVSITAYHPQWQNELSSRGKRFNLQLALRQEPNLGLYTTVTIGTPIITTEY